MGYSRDKIFKRNWDEKIDKVKHILASWKDRDLSLIGKVQIIKTFVVSQFVLPASLLVVPPEITKRLKLCYMNFFGVLEIKLRELK